MTDFTQGTLTLALSRRLDLNHHPLFASGSLHLALVTVRLTVSSTDRAIVSCANLWAGTLSRVSRVRNATDGIRIRARFQLTDIQGWEIIRKKNINSTKLINSRVGVGGGGGGVEYATVVASP